MVIRCYANERSDSGFRGRHSLEQEVHELRGLGKVRLLGFEFLLGLAISSETQVNYGEMGPEAGRQECTARSGLLSLRIENAQLILGARSIGLEMFVQLTLEAFPVVQPLRRLRTSYEGTAQSDCCKQPQRASTL